MSIDYSRFDVLYSENFIGLATDNRYNKYEFPILQLLLICSHTLILQLLRIQEEILENDRYVGVRLTW